MHCLLLSREFIAFRTHQFCPVTENGLATAASFVELKTLGISEIFASGGKIAQGREIFLFLFLKLWLDFGILTQQDLECSRAW